jgi:hypothetical protein
MESEAPTPSELCNSCKERFESSFRGSSPIFEASTQKSAVDEEGRILLHQYSSTEAEIEHHAKCGCSLCKLVLKWIEGRLMGPLLLKWYIRCQQTKEDVQHIETLPDIQLFQIVASESLGSALKHEPLQISFDVRASAGNYLPSPKILLTASTC